MQPVTCAAVASSLFLARPCVCFLHLCNHVVRFAMLASPMAAFTSLAKVMYWTSFRFQKRILGSGRRASPTSFRGARVYPEIPAACHSCIWIHAPNYICRRDALRILAHMQPDTFPPGWVHVIRSSSIYLAGTLQCASELLAAVFLAFPNRP